MSDEDPKPKWWRLYAILPLALLLLLLESQLSLPPAGHQLAQTGIAIGVVGLMAMWVVSNAYALLCEEEGKRPLEIMTLPANADLRRKLQRDPARPAYVISDTGAGYRLREDRYDTGEL
jgi:hypothetical protein